MAFDGEDFGNVLKYPFADDQWFSKLCLQGAVLILLSFILVGIPFLVGYMVRCVQKGLKGERTLPGWDEWGTFWSLGWKVIAVNILYVLPVYVVMGILIFALVMVGSFAQDNTGLNLIIAFFGLVFYIAIFAYSIALMFIQSTTNVIVALERPLAEAFQLKKIWSYIKANIGSIIFAWLAALVAGVLAYFGLILLFIGILFTFNYAAAVTGYSQGLVYKKSKVKL